MCSVNDNHFKRISTLRPYLDKLKLTSIVGRLDDASQHGVLPVGNKPFCYKTGFRVASRCDSGR